MRVLLTLLTLSTLASVYPPAGLFAQQQGPQVAKRTALPTNMDCEKLTGDKEVPSDAGTTILKRGTDYYLCHSKSGSILSKARTAAVAVHSTQTISCGDGSSDDCLREDTATERQIEGLANKTDLWRYFDKAPPAKADIILRFVANNRASSYAQITLQVQDSDGGAWLYSESRTVTDIENDVSRLVNHLITKSGRTPLRSKEEMEKVLQCALVADQLSMLQLEYQKKRDDYDFKNAHPLDAQMEECNLHWREWVCLKRGGDYTEQWNESGQELQRKLSLEYEELQKLEQQINTLNKSGCQSQSAPDR